MIDGLLGGMSEVFQLTNVLAIMAGVIVGYFIGAMPGLTPSIGIALLIPFTFTMDAVPAMLLLTSLYLAAEYGGGITAILLNTPGTPAAAATSFDGYPMTLQGKAGEALTISIVASSIGAFISAILLILSTVPIATFALAFGPAQYFALALFGLSIVVSLSKGSLVKGALSMLLGLLVVTIGLDLITGLPRFAVTTSLFEGIPFLPALIGLFALSEVLYLLENPKQKKEEMKKIEGVGAPLSVFKDLPGTLFRSSILGYVIGVIPGAGATIASFVSYNEAKRVAKDCDTFGQGNPKGIAASEAANNAAATGSFAPLLALGIPGSASTAILIGALTLQGVQAGPLLFTRHPEIPYSIFVTLLISIPLMLAVGLLGVRLWVKVVLIPNKVLAVIVAGICFLGSFAFQNSMYTVWIMVVFGLLGYAMRKADIPTTPMVLALVLGPMMESNFRRAMMLSHGDYLYFLSSPISLILILLTLATVIVPVIQSILEKKKMSDEQISK